jgi:hypothetical protein
LIEESPDGIQVVETATVDHVSPPDGTLRSQLQSPHFFSMNGIPKFGKGWLENFIPDEEL